MIRGSLVSKEAPLFCRGTAIQGEEGEGGRANHGHGVGHLCHHDFDGRDAGRVPELISPVLGSSPLGLGRREATIHIAGQLLHHLRKGQGVGRPGYGLVALTRDMMALVGFEGGLAFPRRCCFLSRHAWGGGTESCYWGCLSVKADCKPAPIIGVVVLVLWCEGWIIWIERL